MDSFILYAPDLQKLSLDEVNDGEYIKNKRN